MRFNVYGKYDLEIERLEGKWVVMRVVDGKRRLEPDINMPSALREDELIPYLDDLLHEFSTPGTTIQRIR